jgi:hypothetical protein
VEEPAVAVRVGVVDTADMAGGDHHAVLDLDEGVQLQEKGVKGVVRAVVLDPGATGNVISPYMDVGGGGGRWSW